MFTITKNKHYCKIKTKCLRYCVAENTCPNHNSQNDR